mgnify:CR=1 FL=1
MSILVDTGAWYALADKSDSNHEAAKSFYVEKVGILPFVTTEAIVVETWALINAHLGRIAAMSYWSMLLETRLPVLFLEPVEIEIAWVIGKDYPDQDFSFVDCTTFALMERRGITEAFTFDRHFWVFRYGPGRRKALSCLP